MERMVEIAPRCAGSEETKGKRRTENDEGERERDGRIRKDECVGPSLDECEFHRVAIELLRKPVALWYLHASEDGKIPYRRGKWLDARRRQGPALASAPVYFSLLLRLQRVSWPVPGNLFHLTVVRTWRMVR